MSRGQHAYAAPASQPPKTEQRGLNIVMRRCGQGANSIYSPIWVIPKAGTLYPWNRARCFPSSCYSNDLATRETSSAEGSQDMFDSPFLNSMQNTIAPCAPFVWPPEVVRREPMLLAFIPPPAACGSYAREISALGDRERYPAVLPPNHRIGPYGLRKCRLHPIIWSRGCYSLQEPGASC